MGDELPILCRPLLAPLDSANRALDKPVGVGAFVAATAAGVHSLELRDLGPEHFFNPFGRMGSMLGAFGQGSALNSERCSNA